jgi:hypothetical protein
VGRAGIRSAHTHPAEPGTVSLKPAPLRLACLGFLALAFTGASPLAADTPECAGPGETRFRILLREFSGPDADLDAREVPDGRVAQIREAAGRPLSQSGSVPDGARIFVSEKLGAGDEARALRAIRSSQRMMAGIGDRPQLLPAPGSSRHPGRTQMHPPKPCVLLLGQPSGRAPNSGCCSALMEPRRI